MPPADLLIIAGDVCPDVPGSAWPEHRALAMEGQAAWLREAFAPWLRACRLSLFFPPAALMPSAIGAMAFKLSDILVQKGYAAELVFRPSETIELYLYYFILTYLIVFARRIREIEASDGGAR